MSKASESAFAKQRDKSKALDPAVPAQGSIQHAEPTTTSGEVASAMTNQFSLLSTASLVDCIPSNEIEEISSTRVRIRGNGRLVVFLGTCGLFVKSGTVSVCGAILTSSPNKVTVYSPASHALPAIEAIEGFAEIELESAEVDLASQGLQTLVDVGFPDVWCPPERRGAQANLTYHIFGYHFQPGQSTASRYRVLDTRAWNSLITEIAEDARKASTSLRILIHGTPSSGVSTFAQNLLNRLVKQVDPRVGVSFVDLEATRPGFTPPGTIALQQVKAPVFGPPYARPAANSGPVSKMHFVGATHRDTDNLTWYNECALDLLRAAAKKGTSRPTRPVIIHAPKWLSSLTEKEPLAQQLWTEINPTHIVHMADSKDVSLDYIPKQFTGSVHRLPTLQVEQYNLPRQAEMSMQAYFHLVFNKTGERFFSNKPVRYDQSKTFTLSYDPYGTVKGVILNPSAAIVTEHIKAAVIGKIVAVLSVSSMALSAAGFDEETQSGSTALYKFDGDLATTKLPAEEISCLGFGYVQRIEEGTQKLTITTPITEVLLTKPFSKGEFNERAQLVLVVPGGEAGWLEKETAKL